MKKTEKNILIAFILNITFSIFEFLGGLFTNSVAILSDSLHDIGDAASIGISYFLEKKSKQKPNEKYTYGYLRYSILGAFITTTILAVGSTIVIIESIKRIINPVEVNYSGMIIFAIVGVIVNLIASIVTKEGDSLNQKSVNLHMFEDVLGWIVVLIGSILMKYTNITILDPIMSIGVALFIFVTSIRNLKEILDLFLEKTPKNIDINKLKKHLNEIKGIEDIHHVHVWSMDNINNYATLHIVTNSKNLKKLKHKIREEMEEHGINHVTIEIENEKEICDSESCNVKGETTIHHHHH